MKPTDNGQIDTDHPYDAERRYYVDLLGLEAGDPRINDLPLDESSDTPEFSLNG